MRNVVGKIALGALIGLLGLGCRELNPDFDEPLADGTGTAGSATGPGDGTTTMLSATSLGSQSASGSGDSADSGPEDSTATTSDDDGSTTTGPAIASLETLRVDRDCMRGTCNANAAHVCFMAAEVTDSAPLVGDEGVVYDVTLRFRGVVEMSEYAGGTDEGDIYVGGGPAPASWDPYRLTVSEPAMDYWLNPLGTGDLFLHPVDFEFEVPVAAGATVTLYTDSGNDSCGVFNKDAAGDPIVVPGIDPAPEPFDGQFLQIDAVGFAVQG